MTHRAYRRRGHFLGGIQQRHLSPAYGLELTNLFARAAIDAATTAHDQHDLNDRALARSTATHRPAWCAALAFVYAGRAVSRHTTGALRRPASPTHTNIPAPYSPGMLPLSSVRPDDHRAV